MRAGGWVKKYLNAVKRFRSSMATYDEAENDGVQDDKTILDAAKEFLKRAQEAEKDNREAALDDIKFAKLSEQWPESIRSDREREGRPCLTINKLPSFIRQVVNDCRQNKPAIHVSGVDSESDPETADILTGLIRNIEYTSKADIAYDTAADNAISSGFGYIRVSIDYAYDDSFDLDIKINAVPNQFSVYGDPDSTEADSSDWNCAMIVNLVPMAEFKKKYKGKDTKDFDAEAYNRLESPWKIGDSVQVAEYWEREEIRKEIFLLSDGSIVEQDVLDEVGDLLMGAGLQVIEQRTVPSYKVTQYVVSGAEILETNEWPGRYIPLIPVYGEDINVEGVRHLKSMIRDSKDAQRMFNYWRTTTTELVALAPKAPFVGPEEAFTGVDSRKWASANLKSYSYISYRGQIPPARQPFAGVPAGAIQEAINANDDIQATMGMFGSSIGKEDNAISGRAILARQRESDTGTFHFIDNLSRAIRHTGCVVVDLIPHVYNGKRVIRVLGEDGKQQKSVQLGQPVEVDGMTRIYDLSVGKYDVAVKSGPSYNTKREEAAAQIMELIRVDPTSAQVIRDLLAENLDWPGAQDIAKRFKALLPPQLQEGGENQQLQMAQQQMQQLQQQAQQAIVQLNQQIEVLKNDKSIDKQEADIKAYDAETKRLQVTQQAMNPAQIQALVLQTMQQVLTTPDILNQQQVPEQQIQQPINQGQIQ